MEVYIIGAGGVASYVIPHLKRIYKDELFVHIQDKDVLELRNLDRQVFRPEFVGQNKAEALLATNEVKGKVYPTWFMEGMDFPKTVKLVICVADNNACREAAMIQAEKQGIPIIVGGNEKFDQMAFIHFPEFAYDPEKPITAKLDARLRYPEIITDESANPIRCTDETVVASAPQTAVANAGAAQHIFHLLWAWFRNDDGQPTPKGEDFTSMCVPIEVYTSLYRVDFISRKSAEALLALEQA